LNEYFAFGEHEWLNLEALKKIPDSLSLISNAFVANIPNNGLGKHEHSVCEF
jgi:hypothetical protein